MLRKRVLPDASETHKRAACQQGCTGELNAEEASGTCQRTVR